MNLEVYLSIVVPCYNVENYLSKFISSAVECSSSSVEIILVNDGSQDATGDMCQEYANQHLNVFVYHKKNGGVSSARNLGLVNARGKFILFADSDDILHGKLISTLINTIKKTESDIFILGFNQFDQRDGSKNSIIPHYNYSFKNNTEIMKRFLPNILGISSNDIQKWDGRHSIQPNKEWGAVWRYIFRKQVIIENNILFDENITLNEDSMFVSTFCIFADTMSTIPDQYYDYYIRYTGNMVKNIEGIGLLQNKIALVKAREKISELALERRGMNITHLYSGSLALSTIEIYNNLLKSNSMIGTHKLIINYLNLNSVKDAIKIVPIFGGGFKYKFIILLLKSKSYWLILLGIRTLGIFGISLKQ